MRSSRLLAACIAAGFLSAACASTDIDETDHGSFAGALRVRKEIGNPDAVGHMHLEGEWIRADGDTDDFDYTIDTLNFGVGLEGLIGSEGWGGSVVGLSLQRPEFEAGSSELDQDLSAGPYGVVEGGWHASKVVEPYGRMTGAVYFPDVSTLFSTEIGVRFHIVDHCALFGGWRYAHYVVEGLDGPSSDDSIGLDTSGPILGLSLAF